jgi:glucosamine--fructose-6-phosphate aminotransferase (isomerizing)
MCGIVGILGTTPVAPLLVDALKRLEYRGYDSAGIATLENGHLARRRSEGKLKKLEERLAREPLGGKSGIGHTRWATHGAATETNAHPHGTHRLALVHNGIIENFRELKAELQAGGAVFETATDTEVIAHLITKHVDAGMSPEAAVQAALGRLTGAFAIAVIFDGEDDLMIGARRGSPLAIGYKNGEMFFGSDAIALAPFTNQLAYLEDGDVAVLTRKGAQVYDATGAKVERPIITSLASSLLVDKGNFRDYMSKEIGEQPEVVGHTFGRYLDFSAGRAVPPASLTVDWRRLREITLVACGSAYYAALVARYWFERLAHLRVNLDVASEFRYREAPTFGDELMVVVSQSGETADTLAGLRYGKDHMLVAAIVNVESSTMVREANFYLPTLAGPEIGVASTKAFTCQLAVLLSLAIMAGKARGVLSDTEEARLVAACGMVPGAMIEAHKKGLQIAKIANDQLNGTVEHALFLGRGLSFPVALEGALKLKEVSYVHAEGYAAGELKHGPIALVDKHMPVVVVAPHDHLFEKTLSNAQEVASRFGRIILLTDERGSEKVAEFPNLVDQVTLSVLPYEVAPFAYVVLLQQLAYHSRPTA